MNILPSFSKAPYSRSPGAATVWYLYPVSFLHSRPDVRLSSHSLRRKSWGCQTHIAHEETSFTNDSALITRCLFSFAAIVCLSMGDLIKRRKATNHAGRVDSIYRFLLITHYFPFLAGLYLSLSIVSQFMTTGTLISIGTHNWSSHNMHHIPRGCLKAYFLDRHFGHAFFRYDFDLFENASSL